MIIIIFAVFSTGCDEVINVILNGDEISTSEYIPENNNKKNQHIVDKTQLNNKIKTSKYYDSIKLDNAFNALETQSQKNLYLAIIENIYNFQSEKNNDGFYTSPKFIVEDCTITDREIVLVYEAVIEDNPQFFWVSDWYGYSIWNDTVSFQIYFSVSEKRYLKMNKQLNAVITKILSNLKDNMTEFELELYLHDYIIKNCIYDKNADKDENSFNIYGALVEQKAVCQGYANAFQLLLSYVGINSYKITGKSQGSNHIWNVVNIEDEDYYVDITWDDTKDYCMYDYFNITTKQLLVDHKLAPLYKNCDDEEIIGDNNINFNILSAKCNAKDYSYYVYKGSHIESDDNNLEEDLYKVAKNKSKFFHIYVNPKYKSVSQVYNELFDSKKYDFVKYIYKVNSKLENNKLKTNTYVSKKEHLNTLTVELVYE